MERGCTCEQDWATKGGAVSCVGRCSKGKAVNAAALRLVATWATASPGLLLLLLLMLLAAEADGLAAFHGSQ